MPAFESVDITSQAFSLRLANLLVATRTRNGLGVGAVAKASGGRFSRRDLKEFERGGRPLDEQVVDELAQLYACDLGLILPLRLPVVVSANRVSAGGVHQEIDGQGPDATLAAYLTLVRTLRRQKKAPVVDLRRDDVEVLAGFLAVPSDRVVHRLATLMQATQTKRTAMVGVLATGAVVIGLVGTAVAVGSSETSTPDSPIPSDTSQVVETTVPETTVPETTVPETTVPQTTAVDTVAPQTVPTTVTPTAPPTTEPPTVTTARPPVTAPPTTAVPVTQPPLVDTDLTTTTTIVDTGSPPLP
ncbi:MAG: hypothetical protein HY828_09860 [Actinobacteria bacterium]|nr:hypothetical protein [Actinomycetota bacterium]